MPVLHAVVLGIVQGLAEFLPISSSGHLSLVPWLLHWREFAGNDQLQKTFDLALHVGTFVGSFAYFRKDIVRYARAALHSLRLRRFSADDERMAWLLLVASMPAAVVGVVFESQLVQSGREWLIGVMLIVFGVLLGVVDRVSASDRAQPQFGWRDALLMGAGQALALQPGVSRSGVTTTVGRFLRFDRTSAVRLSFLMSLPITAGAALYKLTDQLRGDGIPRSFYAAFVWGSLAAAIVGFFAITILLRMVRTRSFSPFVIYRVAAGVFVLAVYANRS